MLISAQTISLHNCLAAVLWQSPLMLPVVVAVGAVLAVAVLWLYPPQVRTLRATWRWTLPGLRGIALAAMVVALLRPMVVRPKTVAEHGSVVLLIDQSRSMSVTDARSPADLVALAASMGMLPAGSRDATARVAAGADELVRAIDEAERARSEMEYASLAGRGTRPAQERLDEAGAKMRAAAGALAAQQPSAIDALAAQFAALQQPPQTLDEQSIARFRGVAIEARSAIAQAQQSDDAALYQSDPAVRQACETLGGLSRLGLIQAALGNAADEKGLLARLPEGTPVYAYAFGSDVMPLPRLKSAQGALSDASALRSDITGAVRSVLDRSGGRLLQAVILLSDGRQVGGTSAVTSGLSSGTSVPVFAISLAAPLQRDAAIVDVQMPQGQFADETATLRVRLRGTGLVNRPLNLRISSDDGTVNQTQTVTFGEDATAVGEFEFSFAEPGLRRLSITADTADGEVSAENNTAERLVKVLKDRVAVTAISGTAGWDYQYVRNALSRTAWVELTDAIVHGESQRPPIPAEKLLEQHLIILSDLGVQNLAPDQWDAVYRVVVERGGSVILMASEPRMLVEFGSHPLLAALLAYPSGFQPAWRIWPGEQPSFRLIPSPAARDNPALRLQDPSDESDSASQESAARWHQLPALFGYLPMTELKPNTQPLLIERESGAAVLTESRVGLGRVLLMGTGETWRWRNQVGERDHDRFWLQLVRYSADEPYAASAGQGRLFLDADRVQAEPGEPVRVRGKVLGPDHLPSRAASQVLRVTKDGQTYQDVEMSVLGPAGSGRYEGLLADLPPGEYELSLADAAVPGDEAKLPLRVAAASEAEMADLSGDPEMLRRLAEASGGLAMRLDEIGTLSERVAEARQRQSELAEHRLWDSPYLYGLVLACLGAEWAMRKRFGLA